MPSASGVQCVGRAWMVSPSHQTTTRRFTVKWTSTGKELLLLDYPNYYWVTSNCLLPNGITLDKNRTQACSACGLLYMNDHTIQTHLSCSLSSFYRAFAPLCAVCQDPIVPLPVSAVGHCSAISNGVTVGGEKEPKSYSSG